MQLLIVDDHPLVREAMVSVLAGLVPDAQIHQAGTAAQAVSVLRAGTLIDLMLLDLQLPDADGMDVLALVREQFVQTAVVVLSGEMNRQTVHRVLEHGAVGFIPKSESREVLVGALGLVLAGGVYVPPMALGSGATQVAGGGRQGGVSRPAAVAGSTPTDRGLTERQIDVLALLMQGKNNKLICRALGLAEPTVKNHVSAILRTLDVGSRTEAVLEVARLGWQLPVPPQSARPR